jgi:myo-inositol catabolism protein IolC
VPPTQTDRLYFLAFDHRGFFERELAEGDAPSASPETILAAKRLILEGVRVAGEESDLRPPARAGILVDDQYGAELVAQARELGVLVAMPAERSERQVFELHHGERFGEEIEAADPDVTKVLVRHNVQGDAAGNALQATRLRELSDWLAARERTFLLELLVEPTAEQLDRVGGRREEFERTLRPPLIEAAIRELQDAGVEPGIWKVEGLDDPADARAIAEVARRDGREHVVCVVLGSGAEAQRVEGWLRTAAATEGFAGFAIGRSIWWPPLRALKEGEIDAEQAAREIARGYLRFVEVFEQARADSTAVGA